MDEFSPDTTGEMLRIVKEIEEEAGDWNPADGHGQQLSAWAERMRQLLGAPGPGRRRKAKEAK